MMITQLFQCTLSFKILRTEEQAECAVLPAYQSMISSTAVCQAAELKSALRMSILSALFVTSVNKGYSE